MQKINYAYNIYEKLYIENLATDFDFDKIAIKQIEKYEIDMEKISKHIFRRYIGNS